ncbi:putative aldo/keto reductase [Hypoxylon sp. FL1284]|nr:putative aldo/keto reductase [Hypoxylon sp. FL1284]
MPTLVGKEVGPIGFGMMGLTWRYEVPPIEQAIETLKAALNNGMNLWVGGEFYGTPEYNSLTVLERYFEKYPEDADKVVLSIKGAAGAVGAAPDGSPEGTRSSIDNCIRQLNGRKKIDIFEFARRDQNVPMKTSFEIVEKEYIQTGKVGGIMLSEVRAETIHEAVKITKVVGVEAELSLFSREILDNGVVAACAQYDLPLIAYSPVGRGFLTGQYTTMADLDKVPTHYKSWPWFLPENFKVNVEMGDKLKALAQRKGVAPAQLAIGWIRRLPGWRKDGPMPKTVVPIPGATTAARVAENAALVDLSDAEMAEIDDMLLKFSRAGNRYPDYVPTDS